MSSATVRVSDLLDAVADGDRAALEELYKRTCAKLYGVVFRILRQPELAAEALRDTYLWIWQDAGAFDPRVMDCQTFLVAHARRAALALARRRDATLLEVVTPPAPAAGDGGVPPAMSAELKRLLASLAALSEDVRRMLLLAYYDGWSRQALAAEFDAPVATVATWLRRALSQLRHNGAR